MRLSLLCSLVASVLVVAPHPAGADRLGRADISAGIRAIQPAVQVCFRRHKTTTRVTAVRIAIQDGRVQTAAVTTDGARPLHACVERAVRQARFRAVATSITVHYPFVDAARAPDPTPPPTRRMQ